MSLSITDRNPFVSGLQLSAEPGPDAKGTKKGKKKKKGQSTDKPERSPAAAKDVPTGKVDDVGLPHQLALVTSASPNDGAGSPPVREAGDSKAAAQVTGESDLSSRSGAGVEKRGGRNQPSGERRPKGSEQGPGSAGSRATSDRPSVGAGARRGAAEAADVINDQLEVGRLESWRSRPIFRQDCAH